MIKRFTHEEILAGENRVNRDDIVGFADAVLISMFDPTKMFVRGAFYNISGERKNLIYVEFETSNNQKGEGLFFPIKELTEVDLGKMSAPFILNSPWYDFVIFD